MTSYVKTELYTLIPILLGSFFMAACSLYLSRPTIDIPFYSIFLIGIGLSGVLGFWFQKTRFFVTGILLSTPVWTIYSALTS